MAFSEGSLWKDRLETQTCKIAALVALSRTTQPLPTPSKRTVPTSQRRNTVDWGPRGRARQACCVYLLLSPRAGSPPCSSLGL